MVGGGLAPFEKNIKRGKLLIYVNEVSRIIRTVVRSPAEFPKETKGVLSKTVSPKRRVSSP